MGHPRKVKLPPTLSTETEGLGQLSHPGFCSYTSGTIQLVPLLVEGDCGVVSSGFEVGSENTLRK